MTVATATALGLRSTVELIKHGLTFHASTAHTNVNIHVCVQAANWFCSLTVQQSNFSFFFLICARIVGPYVKVPVGPYPQMYTEGDKETFNERVVTLDSQTGLEKNPPKKTDEYSLRMFLFDFLF